MSTAPRSDVHEEEPSLILMTDEEAREAFDRAARSLLGISGDEFLRRWDAGEYDGVDTSAVMEMYLLIPWVRDVEPPNTD